MPEPDKRPQPRANAAQSMGLLTQITSSALDPEYVRAYAARKDQRKHGFSAQLALVLVMAILGVGFATAANTLRQPAPADADARIVLTNQIEEANTQITALEARVSELSGEVQNLQTEALTLQDPELAAQIATDELALGAVAISGNGLKINLNNGPQAVTEVNQRVLDTDLQIVVNGLWQSGAQAISINSVRLTPLTSIRAAGEAVLVGLTPVSSPFEVQAVGEPAALGEWFDQSYARSYLNLLSSTYQIGVQITRVNDDNGMSLSGSRTTSLRHATATE